MDKRGINGINNAHFGVLGGRPPKAVIQYTKDGEFVCEFKSMTEASNALGLRLDGISNALSGRTKSCGGYVWKYMTDEFTEEIVECG
jgi:hypothetical protein